MFFLSYCGQSPFPHWESQSSSPLTSLTDPWPVVGAAQILSCFHSCVFLPPVSTAIRTSMFSFVGVLSVFLYIPHRVCLLDLMDLMCSMYSWWEGFGSSSLATLPLGFNCCFISTSACGLSTGVCSWGWAGGLGFAPVRARCGGGAVAWVAGRSGSTRYSGELAAGAARNIVL